MTWLYLCILVVVIIFITALRRFRMRRHIRQIGDQGESSVASILAHLPKEYVVFNDLLLRKGDGRTAQIDHVVISPYGIFVIETKFRHGTIDGYPNAKTWKQHIGRSRHTFENPCHQNAIHVRTIAEHLPFVQASSIRSLVVFPDEAQLHIHGGTQEVFHANELLRAIRRERTHVVADAILHKAKKGLESDDIDGARARRAHVRDVKAHHRP